MFDTVVTSYKLAPAGGQVGGTNTKKLETGIKGGNTGKQLAKEADRKGRIANNATSRQGAKQRNASTAQKKYDSHGTTRAAASGIAGSNFSSKTIKEAVKRKENE